MFSKNIIIIVLILFIIVLIFYGNVIIISENYLKNAAGLIGSFISYFLSILGFGVGSTLNYSSNVIAHTTIKGVDIVNDAINDAGNLMKNGYKKDDKKDDKKKTPESFVEYSYYKTNDAVPSESENIIQKPIGTTKNKWCLVGNNTGLINCKKISDEYKCSSGQSYPSQFDCLLKQF